MSRPLLRPVLVVPPSCKGVLAKHVIGLAKQCVDKSALVELGGVLHAIVGTAAAFDAIPAREFIDAEQVAVVKHQALRIFGRPASDLLFIRPHDHLSDRLYGLRPPRLHVDERIAILKTYCRHAAHQIGVARCDEVRNTGLVADLHGASINAYRSKRSEDLTELIGDTASPL